MTPSTPLAPTRSLPRSTAGRADGALTARVAQLEARLAGHSRIAARRATARKPRAASGACGKAPGAAGHQGQTWRWPPRPTTSSATTLVDARRAAPTWPGPRRGGGAAAVVDGRWRWR
ncbi:MAG: hypothetical protein U0232_07090 [Thermomicrobiales bacterium]